MTGKPPRLPMGMEPDRSTFLKNTLAGPNIQEYQRAAGEATEYAESLTLHTPLLAENMMGAWGQRCDTLMVQLQTAIAHQPLFRAGFIQRTYDEGVKSEAWMDWWNMQRRLRS